MLLISLNDWGTPFDARVLIGTPVESILDQAQRIKADLILMGSRGRQGVLRFVLGSVSYAVLHRTTCPVLVVT